MKDIRIEEILNANLKDYLSKEIDKEISRLKKERDILKIIEEGKSSLNYMINNEPKEVTVIYSYEDKIKTITIPYIKELDNILKGFLEKMSQ